MRTADLLSVKRAEIGVLKDKINEQSSTHDKMNNKMFAILTLTLTLAGLLSNDIFKISGPFTNAEKLFFYGALALLVTSTGLIFLSYRARRTWSTPMGELEVTKMDNAKNELDAIIILHDEYREVYKSRDIVISNKAFYLNTSLYLFILSAIILIVLKIGE